MFICPNCQSRLARTQNQLGIYWACPNCGGRAVGLAVLRKAAARDFVNRVWGLARDGNGTLGRRCPMCNKPMFKVTLPQTASLKLDVCKRYDFVWFDPNELEAAPPAPVKPRESDESALPQKAREALALYKVRRLAAEARDDRQPDLDWTATVAALLDVFI